MASPDPLDKDYSAIHGNFIPLQSPDGLFLIPPRSSHRMRTRTRTRSRSPQRRRQDQGVHLHLSLTDAQMDTLATLAKDETAARPHRHADDAYDAYDAYGPQPGHVRAPSPSRAPQLPTRPPPQSPTRPPHTPYPPHPPYTPGRASTDTRATSNTAASSGSGRSPAWTHPHAAAYADQIAEEPERGPEPEPEPGMTDASSSVYSMDDLARMLPHVHPLYVQKMAEMSPGRGMSPGQSPGQSPMSPRKSPMSPGKSPGMSGMSGMSPVMSPDKTHEQDAQIRVAPERANHPLCSDPPLCSDHPLYSPLEPTFAARTGHKVLVGHNGWLERTGKTDRPPPSPAKPAGSGGGLLETLKRMAKATESRVRGSGESAGTTTKTTTTAAATPTRASAIRTLRISLDPREQSLLYCELEFLLTAALDAFLDAQFHAGRLDAAQYKRVVDAWQRQGRPRVVGFRYDLETQLDLVQRHLHAGSSSSSSSSTPSFLFHGPRAADPVAVAALLASMKVNARALRIRTFCQPDSAVAKQLLDSQALLELLGTPEARQVQLAEVVQFFKIVLEREHVGDRERDMRGWGRGPGDGPDMHTPPRLRPSKTAHSLEHAVTPPRAATVHGR